MLPIEDEYGDSSFALELQCIAIKRIETKSPKEFFFKVNTVTGGLLEPAQIAIVMDYPDSAKIISKVFKEYLY